MKKTKIVCTMGPACQNEETLTKMALAGMNVARLNFSHGDYAEHKKNIDLIKKVREKLHIPLPIMLDTKGPELRIKTFKDGKITLKEGDAFSFTTEEIEGDQTRVSVSYKGIVNDLAKGDTILLNNGLMVFKVTEVTKTEVRTVVEIGGVLSNKKSMFFPDKLLTMTYLSEADKSDILFGIEQEIDFIACSFVSKAQDIIDIRNLLKANGNPDIDLIAKIESRAGVNNIDEILEVSNGIMIGRGDMGVEIPFEELPAIQKHLIDKCRLSGKRCITATEMLESMINQPRPTRAEISDVANAVYDGTSAIMLSGETAAGRYPVQAVEAMARIALETESHLNNKYGDRRCLILARSERRALPFRVRIGGRYRRESHRRLFEDGRHRKARIPFPSENGYHRHDRRTPFIQKTRPILGRDPRHERRVHFHGRAFLPRETRGGRDGTREKGRPYRDYGRQSQRQARKFQRHQHRTDIKV